MTRGECDSCGAKDVRLRRAEVTGIETYACGQCHGDAPRRCETDECDPGGECMLCGAANGEACQDQD